MSSFIQPPEPSSGITWADHKGALLLIEPLSVETEIQTKFGKADAVKANVAVIDGAGAGETYTETLIFPKLLLSQTKGHIGVKILGRLTQGTAKNGQDPPWILDAATPEDQAKGEAHIAETARSKISSASPPF